MLPQAVTKTHLSVISGVTPAGKLLTQVHAESIKGPAVARFLAHVQHQLGSSVSVVWDQASIHRSQPVRELLGTARRSGMEVVFLPGGCDS